MGTRADFYIGRGPKARWIGSIAWDGNPDGIVPFIEEKEELWPGHFAHKSVDWPNGKHLFDSKTPKQFKERFKRFCQFRDDVTLPEQGWPWPWENSNTTDFAYAFDGGKVYGTCFGHGWWLANTPRDEDDDMESIPKIDDWPNMATGKHARPGSARSGLMVFTAKA